MFLPQNVLYTAIYIAHTSFRYDEFRDMRIRLRCDAEQNFYELNVTHD
jgi:hypothetical protein